ncbi:MAG TPA: hypothetical protein VL294_01245 [Pseudolysinimonas sp.]|jgi:hypothetical protein|nr:hypothetical protein [Pseudolysinimonas sp.]
MSRILDAIDHFGGMASTGELASRGVERWELDIDVFYGKVLRIRKGLWARPGLSELAVQAQRAGGRLACVSALAYHGVIEPVPGTLHVAAPLWAASWRPGRPNADVIRHWSRNEQRGDRMAVAPEDAWAQFALCREVSGRDVRLRQTDSL